MIEGRGKTLTFGALDTFGITALWARFASGVPVLAYHGVTARSDDSRRNRRRLHVTAELFVEHLRELTERWRPIALQDLVRACRERKSLPRRAAVLTFDDGYRNVRTVAAPLLRQFGVPFTLFVITEARGRRLWMDRLEASVFAAPPARLEWRGMTIDLESEAGRESTLRSLAQALNPLGESRAHALDSILALLGKEPTDEDEDRDLLSWGEVRDLRNAGVEVGAHSDQHEPLTQRSLPEVRGALTTCRLRLEEELGPGKYAFCYPYGAWDPERASAVREAGFNCALTTDAGRNRLEQDVFALRRLLVGADDSPARLRASLSGLRALTLRGQW